MREDSDPEEDPDQPRIQQRGDRRPEFGGRKTPGRGQARPEAN